MDMIPIEIPVLLHQQLAVLASRQGRTLEEMVREFLSAGLCREQAWQPRQHLLAECYRVMAQDNRTDAEGFLPLQGETMG
jgi:plasmid stability protein